MWEQKSTTNQGYYLLTDHLGSITKSVDANGLETSESHYKAWREERITNGSGSYPGIYYTCKLVEIIVLKDMTRAIFNNAEQGNTDGTGASAAAYWGLAVNEGKGAYMMSYILGLLVITMFTVFTISQIKQGRDDIKNSRRTKWFNILRIIIGTILLIWSIIVDLVVLSNIIFHK